MTVSRNASVLAAVTGALFAWPPGVSRAGDAPFYVRKATWHESLSERRASLETTRD